MNDRWLDWLLGSVPALLFWLIGCGGQRARGIGEKEIHVPLWIARLIGGRNGSAVGVNSMAVLLLGASLFLLNAILALVESSHEVRVAFYTIGFILFLILGAGFALIVNLSRK